MTRYGIAEWFGEQFTPMSAEHHQSLAKAALRNATPSVRPFQAQRVVCGKRGGVYSLQQFEQDGDCVVKSVGSLVVTCPKRLEQGNTILVSVHVV